MIEIILTSLISSLTVIMIVIFLSNLRFNDKNLFEILLDRKNVTFPSIILLIVLVPVVVSLLRGTWLSPKELGMYTRELLVSGVIVVSFSITWKVLDNSTSMQCLSRVVHLSSNHLDEPPIKLQIEMPLLTCDKALQAWDNDEILENKVKEIQLLESLNKWLGRKSEVGWIELSEEIDSGNWLQHPVMRSIIERELRRVQQDPHRNGKYAKRLKERLNINSSFYSKFPKEERARVFKQTLESILSIKSMEYSNAN